MDEQNTSKEQGKVELDDIFADAKEPEPEKAAAQEIINQEIVNKTQTSQPLTLAVDDENIDILGRLKKYLIIALVVVILAAIGGAVYFFRQPFQTWLGKYIHLSGAAKTNNGQQPSPVNNNTPTNTNTPVDTNVPVNNTNNQPVANTNVTQDPNKIDSDHDGLTDVEEKALGTNPNSPDSDNDGLFDREEVKVFKTDPMNPDTDGDGYMDGVEVKNKMNPRGPGKLDEMK
jgi:hypothetical protein